MVNASWYQSRALAKTVKDAGQTRRLLALAVIYDGGSPAGERPILRSRLAKRRIT